MAAQNREDYEKLRKIENYLKSKNILDYNEKFIATLGWCIEVVLYEKTYFIDGFTKTNKPSIRYFDSKNHCFMTARLKGELEDLK